MFSTSGVLPSHDVLVSNRDEFRLPPGGTAYVRCGGHCGRLAPGACIIQPHPGLISLSTKGSGTRKFMVSQYVPDPNLFVPARGSKKRGRHGTDARLAWLSKTITANMGLIAVFGGRDELHQYTAIDGVPRGESDNDYHVQIINTSPVEMLLMAGQPLATAVPAMYQSEDRDVLSFSRTAEGRKDSLNQRMIPAVHGSLADVHMIIQRVTHCGELNDVSTGAKQSMLRQDQEGSPGADPTWVPVQCMQHVTTDSDSVYTVSSLVSTINVQRGLLVGMLMELIQTHCISNQTDKMLGRYRVSLGVLRLLSAHPTLLVPVLADMMVRNDTKDCLACIFRQDRADSTDPLVRKIEQLNFELLLIIENWVSNPTRVSRITPFPDGDPALTGFDTTWTDTRGVTSYTSPIQESLTVEARKQNPANSIWQRLFSATEAVRKAQKTTSEGVGVYGIREAVSTVKLESFDLRKSTLRISAQDPNLHTKCTLDDRKAVVAHTVCNLQRSTQDQRSYQHAMQRGLSKVQQGRSGIDTLESGEDLDGELVHLHECLNHQPRDLEKETQDSEVQEPVAGDAETGPGYHFDKSLTQSELTTQLDAVWAEFRQRPEYSKVNRLVETTDKNSDGTFKQMEWWRWTVIQSWRRLRTQEPDEVLNGDSPENELYTLRSILQVGLPDASELQEMNMTEEDRLLMVEMVWRLAPAFYHGPVLPEIRHFTFTKMFMSLVTDVPYRQKPLIIPVANEELVYSAIRAMIKDGVVEASLSPYNNGLLLVAKKAARPGAPASGMRVVLDARGLNHITRRVTWPIEDLGLCLREVAGASFITVTDVLSGFHLIPLDPEC